MSDLFESLLSASTPEERADAFVRFVRESRTISTSGPDERSHVGALLRAIEESPERREQVLGTLSAVLAETDGTALFGDVGIPSDRGFLAELGDRISSRLIPSPRDAHDLSDIVSRLFATDSDVAKFCDLPLSDVHRLVRLLDEGLSREAAAALARGFADGFRLLLSRIQAQGLSRKLRFRSSPGPVSSSPFHRILRSGDALLDAWLSGRDVRPSLQAFNKDSGECRKECRVIHRHLEDAGVSVDVVFGLQVIDRCLTRTALMADVMEEPPGPERSRAIHRLLSRLIQLAHQDKSVFHLVRWNLHLLDRKIVDRTGKTGE
ncbi:MAG: hypothetical protein KJ062_20140, partial [Thermoanaerobaculia bacterium]|nr:hypothetical protein [Thermoanaerobaculia bacterium]